MIQKKKERIEKNDTKMFLKNVTTLLKKRKKKETKKWKRRRRRGLKKSYEA